MKPNTIFVYSTYPTQEAAVTMAQTLLEEKLIACVNYWQSSSMYWWEGKIEQNNEWVMLAKTVDAHFDAIVQIIKEHHPYQLPCIVKIPVQAEENFGAWVTTSCSR